MTQLLIRLFVRHPDDTKDAAVRTAYGNLASLVGMACNLLLCLGKLAAGTLFGSIAIMADALNNLSDASSNVVSLVGFRLAANKAHVCFIGTPHVEMTFTQAMWENMNRKEFLLTGSWMSYSAPFPGEEWELTAHYFATGELKFDPGFIYRTFPLSEAAQAFDLFHHPETVHGKIMLVNG